MNLRIVVVDRRLLQYYERELRHLREVAGEFAGEYPKIASRLSLDEFACADPYVERLLEGFAFLSARVHLKMDSEFPRFTQHLLQTVYPHYLAPTPSMAIVCFEPDLTEGELASGYHIERESRLRSVLGRGEQTSCEYRTGHEVILWPIQVVQAQYYTPRDLGELMLPENVRTGAKAGIRIRLKATADLNFDKLSLDKLSFYLQGSDQTPSRIYEQIFSKALSVVGCSIQRPSEIYAHIKSNMLRRQGLNDDEALLPVSPPSFEGYRLIHEYFAFPQRYLFFELLNLQQIVSKCEDNQLDIIILLSEPDLELERVVDANCFRLYCTPAINLFRKRTDRIHVSDQFSEFHILPDRTRPLDYEVHSIEEVTGYGSSTGMEQEFQSFYSSGGFDDAQNDKAYYAIERLPRKKSSREKLKGRRSSYAGSEVFLSIVDSTATPYHPDLKQLGVISMCTNRDLPLHMPVGRGKTDFTLDEGAPVTSIKCTTGPTQPYPAYEDGEISWRLISHLSLNYLSMTDNDTETGAAGLRDILRLYGNVAEHSIRKQIDGLKSISTKPIMRRIRKAGPISFAQGLEIDVTFDDSAFHGIGPFILGSVLELFFKKYVSINSFTETVIHTVEKGEIMRWPARLGLRQIL